MKEKKQRKKRCYYNVIVYKDRSTDKTVCRVPFKFFHATKEGQDHKYVLCNSKTFKMRGPKKYKDIGEMYIMVDYQGFLDNWFNPMKVRSYVTSLGKEQFYEKFGAYNV